jgi:hypothetical protein
MEIQVSLLVVIPGSSYKHLVNIRLTGNFIETVLKKRLAREDVALENHRFEVFIAAPALDFLGLFVGILDPP